jgi:hypothetical protein
VASGCSAALRLPLATLPSTLDEHVHLGETAPSRLDQVELEILERLAQPVPDLYRRLDRGLHERDATHQRRVNRFQELGNNTAATAAL